MNSFAAMARAIDFEVNRQVAILSGTGGAVVQETRLWEEAGQRTVSMRTKEGLADYRYFPEPDLPTVLLSQSLLDGVLRSMPELPAQVRRALDVAPHLVVCPTNAVIVRSASAMLASAFRCRHVACACRCVRR